MKDKGFSIDVEFPKPGSTEFELFAQYVADAVYERIKKRLQEDSEGAAKA